MLGEEKEQARHVIAEAKRIRAALSTIDGVDSAKMLPLVLRSLGQMIDLAESMLGEQEKYESRLHRRHISPAAGAFNSAPSQQ
jgi:hypothetical protein